MKLALRVLNGPQAGQVFRLDQGENTFGRLETCKYQLKSPGVSKQHFEIYVNGNDAVMRDTNSSNGTFVNGVRAKACGLNIGDKIMISQTLFAVVLLQDQQALPSPQGSHLPVSHQGGMNYPAAHTVGHGGMQPYHPQSEVPAGLPQPPPPSFGGAIAYQQYRFEQFVEKTAMPVVYKLPEQFDFRVVLMGFVAVYILMMTVLAQFPLRMITADAISIESKRRAITVARALSEINQRILRSGDFSGFRTDLILKEEGIEDAYVVSADGKILAPSERVGMTPRQAGTLAKMKNDLKQRLQEFTDTSLDGRVVASVPVIAFDPEQQQNIVKAYAVVIYNPGNLTFDDGRAFSLFIQVFILAIVAGGFLYFFLLKLIQYPLIRLHELLDMAIRDGTDQIQIEYKFAAMQNLMTSINSLLSRIVAGGTPSHVTSGKGARDAEVESLLSMINNPTILFNEKFEVKNANELFARAGDYPDLSRLRVLSDFPEEEVRNTFDFLMKESAKNMSGPAQSRLDLASVPYMATCQPLANAQGEIEYYLVVLSPLQAGEVAA